MSEGIDVYSKYQTVTDWGAVRRSGRDFVFMKMTDGMTTRDTGNWVAQARAAGLAVGAYGYAQPGSAADQYDFLLRTARARGAVDLSPALDLEAPFVPGATATQFAIAWLRRAVESGQIPVFYASDSFMSYVLAAVRSAVPTVWPWIARYGARPKNSFRTWQHSSSGAVPGIKAGGVDLNTGDAPIIAGSRPTPSPAPAPIPIPEEIMQLAEPQFLPDSQTHPERDKDGWVSHVAPVEVGAIGKGGNSTVIAAMWFNLNSCDFGDPEGSTEYALWVGDDSGNMVDFAGSTGPAEGTLENGHAIKGNGNRQFALKPGTRHFTLRYRNHGKARAGYSFPQRAL